MEYSNPYNNLPPDRYWRLAVAESTPFSIPSIYKKKFVISPGTRIGTAGSCFAQHIAHRMRQKGFNVIDAEPAPHNLPEADWKAFGYGIYSARFGNIYTAKQLRQLAEEAFGLRTTEDLVWEKDRRFYDPLRPRIEPKGFASLEELAVHRRAHLKKVKQLFQTVQCMIFTFGLTETFVRTTTGRALPVAPGIIAGAFNGREYSFLNQTVTDVIEDFLEFRRILQENNSNPQNLKFLITVSPVPLTATASGVHIIRANTYSKSTLISATNYLSKLQDVDYFPSYELITNQNLRGVAFESNMRSVSSFGVNLAMEHFFREHHAEAPELAPQDKSFSDDGDAFKVLCDEELLEQSIR